MTRAQWLMLHAAAVMAGFSAGFWAADAVATFAVRYWGAM